MTDYGLDGPGIESRWSGAGDKIDKNEMGRAYSADGEDRGVFQILVGEPEGMSPLGRPKCRWEDDIRMDYQEVGCGGMV
jgi:hypothetical protein